MTIATIILTNIVTAVAFWFIGVRMGAKVTAKEIVRKTTGKEIEL